MTVVRIELNGAALRSIAIAGAESDLRVRANRVLNQARREIKVDTGRARASLTVEFATGPGGVPVARIGSNLEYVLFLHEGTGIYGPRGQMIRPKRARFMVWPATNNSGSGNRRYSGGKTQAYVFARETKGMRGDPFLVRALDAAR